MKRSTLILGFALLVVASTMAMTITFRNDPHRSSSTTSSKAAETRARHSSNNPAAFSHDSRSARARLKSERRRSRDYLDVSVPEESLATLSLETQTELRQRAAKVQGQARRKLERMTGEFELTAVQRRKMFPVLARSTPGYDPAMQIAGAFLDSAPVTPVDEEMHDLLDSGQQDQLIDKEVDRQLWWQDVFSRIEKDLLDSTGGAPPAAAAGTAPPAALPGETPAAPPVERVAPPTRRGGTAPAE